MYVRFIYIILYNIDSVQFSSVTQLCLTLCNPMNCSTPGLRVHHQLLEFTQTHVHQVSDAIQPSHPLSPATIFHQGGHWLINRQQEKPLEND